MDFLTVSKNVTSLSLLLASYYFAFGTFDEIDIKENLLFYRVVQSSIVLNLLSLANIVRTGNDFIFSNMIWMISSTVFFSFVTAGAYSDRFNVKNDKIFQDILKFYNGSIHTGLHVYIVNEARKNVASFLRFST